MLRSMSFVAVRAVILASILPAVGGCASSPTESTFDIADADAAAPDGERFYDPPPLWSGGQPVRIETGQQALALALDDSDVYWQNPGGAVFACPLDGCPKSKPALLSTLLAQGFRNLETLAAGDGVAVFLTASAGISSFNGADPAHSPTTYLSGTGGTFSSLVSDANNVYFVDDVVPDEADAGDGGVSSPAIPTIGSCALGASCASPERLYTAGSSAGLTQLGPLFVSNSEVYFVELAYSGQTTATIRAVPTQGGGTARTVCKSELLFYGQAMAVAGGYAYFTTSGEPTSVYRCATSGAKEASVYVEDLQPYALASDGANLYWTNYVYGPGSVISCALGATCENPVTVASNQESPFAIAANAKSVYWATPSSIFRADR